MLTKRSERIQDETKIIGPQEGPQELFLTLDCDIIIYGGAAGGGKGAKRGAKIVTPYGLRLWEDLKVGDRVCNPFGTTSKIIYITPWEERDMYRVSFADGTSTVVSDNHMWSYWKTGDGKSKRDKNSIYDDGDTGYHWSTATTTQLKYQVDRLKTSTCVDSEGYARFSTIKIPITQPVQFTKSYKCSPITIPPYVLGCLLGDGFLGNYENNSSPTIGEKIVGDIKEILANFEEDGCDWFEYRDCISPYLGVKKEYKYTVIQCLKKLNLYGRLSDTKFIPKEYKLLPVAERFKLVQGLMDTDGYAGDGTKCSAEYCSTSVQLADDMTWVLRSLGAYANISDKQEPYYRDEDGLKHTCKSAWRVYVSARDMHKFFRLSRKFNVCRKTTRDTEYFGKGIVSIELDERAEMRCITVDHPSGLYLTNDFIVTHNSYALLLDPLRNIKVKGYEALLLRRQSTQLTAGGGLWDTSNELYPDLGGVPRLSPRPTWVFPSGAKVAFSHLQHEKSVKAWDGAQLAMIGFDELQHFTSSQFWYMLSRNRSTCGVKSYMRATCNPDPDSFLVSLLAWWLDDEGYPIKERSGVIKWLLRIDGEVQWYDTYEDAQKMYPHDIVPWEVREDKEHPKRGKYDPKSFTFIQASLADNPTLMKLDQSYEGNLSAMFEYERKRLLLGNWYARPQAGELFKTVYWKYKDSDDVPKKHHIKKTIRYWDKASTLPSDVTPDPDYTVGALMALDDEDNFWLLDIRRGRYEPADVESLVYNTAVADGPDVELWIEQDPGSAGKQEVATYIKKLAGFNVHANLKRSSKLVYWKPFAVQVKSQNVYLVRSTWNRAFVDELAAVTDGTQLSHDDQADASSGAFMKLAHYMHTADTTGIALNIRI